MYSNMSITIDDKSMCRDSVTTNVSTIKQDLENTKLTNLILLEYERDKINFPKDKVYLIVIAFVTLLTISLLKGSDHFESMIKIKP